jgi:hypothetical protein
MRFAERIPNMFAQLRQHAADISAKALVMSPSELASSVTKFCEIS